MFVNVPTHVEVFPPQQLARNDIVLNVTPSLCCLVQNISCVVGLCSNGIGSSLIRLELALSMAY